MPRNVPLCGIILSACRLWGYEMDEIVGKSPLQETKVVIDFDLSMELEVYGAFISMGHFQKETALMVIDGSTVELLKIPCPSCFVYPHMQN